MKENIIVDKSKKFALRIIKLYQYLCNDKHEYVLSKQVLRCGTSIGANIKEAIRGQTKADFYAKMNISLKEASETEYWLELLHESGYLEHILFQSIYSDCQEIIKLLMSITKSQKNDL
ncbi:MAG: four helix bundle protein [Faecalibacterium sp.]|nr:four helix bundle protein [Ruminococcus sp.]MCM1392450.1 four helix bundle protein [Ruminococcus sp.]MCM1486177.1 four helix bundle protein [Faecalibacterium sp.]